MFDVPFPGLRPFQRGDAEIFFTPASRLAPSLEKLSAQGLLLLTGPTQCGKSSMVNSGLIDALECGLAPGCGGSWIVLELLTSANPYVSLIDAIRRHRHDVSVNWGDSVSLAAELRQIESGFSDFLARLFPPREESGLLLVMDNLDSFLDQTPPDLLDEFIGHLIGAAQTTPRLLHSVLVMEDDNFGKLSKYDNLTRYANIGLHLLPRPDVVQVQASIEGPVRLFGGFLEPGLLQRLIMDLKDLKAPLPTLQSVLQKLWTQASGFNRETKPVLTLDNYLRLVKEQFHGKLSPG
ncbi:MAG: hypothetical protein HQL65_07505 [Magnetococcales bacterium]|nr:hypothetical protein [Magnetococcales bacterium]